MRSSIGISNLPVSEEVDPGFGPDTEQRRVEFASKLEEEAFSISIGDATKLARSNLITALKLWDKKNVIKIVNDLDLYDIMLIWLIFDICFIVEVLDTQKKSQLEKVMIDKKSWSKFVKNILKSLKRDVSRRIANIDIELERVARIRDSFGGDLIFALKNKNIYEIYKIYEMTYSKLSQSLRDTFLDMITIVDIDFDRVKNIVLSDKNILKEFILLISDSIRDRYQLLGKRIEDISKVVAAFSEEAGKILLDSLKINQREDKTNVEKQVKRYYGINS